jgi:hypothetical protein
MHGSPKPAPDARLSKRDYVYATRFGSAKRVRGGGDGCAGGDDVLQ